jgi:hypothetical protein
MGLTPKLSNTLNTFLPYSKGRSLTVIQNAGHELVGSQARHNKRLCGPAQVSNYPFKAQWLLYVPPVLTHSVFLFRMVNRSRDSSVGTATDYRLDDHGGGSSSPGGVKKISLHIVQTGSGVHPTSYKMGTGGKAAEAWSSPLTSN